MYTRLADYGMIGNCRSMALVSKWGSIDWAALPDFDSPAYLCKILDDKKGGFFDIHPQGYYQSTQVYKENTNILETDFFNHSGRVVLTDFMPLSRAEEESEVAERGWKFFRRLKARSGQHRIRVEVKITPDFAAEDAKINIEGGEVSFVSQEKKILLVSKDVAWQSKKNTVWADIELKEGEEAFFGLGYFLSEESSFFDESVMQKAYDETFAFWQWWALLCRYRGVFRKEIIRSALCLKMLTFAPTGAVIAAPTTSLPEKIGGNLNWDYRYVWLRDASFSLYAFLGLGYLKEAVDFMKYLVEVCLADGKNLQIMYGIRGEKKLEEKVLHHLSGYENSKPVRVGNEAYRQLQHDVFGEVLATIRLFVESGGELTSEMKDFVKNLVDRCVETWNEKDAGIWEPRDGYQHHTYSKLMCWWGIENGLALARKLKLEADLEAWEKEKEKIKEDLLAKGYDAELGAFVDYYGSKNIDSSNLNIALTGFLPLDDSRVLSTLDVTMSTLTKDWFVYRTNNDSDQLKAGEGAFLLSTFWVIDTLSALGRVEEAKIWLEKILYFATPLGLYAEMFDPKSKEHLGNFPQAFTHLGLINSILNLNRAQKQGPERKDTSTIQRFHGVATAANYKLRDSLELLLPSALVRSFSETEKRRTRKHSFLGRLLRRS